MGDVTVTRIYDTAPRGLASNNGFEAEDAERAKQLAQNALNAQFYRAMSEVEKLGDMLWLQDKARHLSNQKDFCDRLSADVEMVAREFAADGALPALKQT